MPQHDINHLLNISGFKVLKVFKLAYVWCIVNKRNQNLFVNYMNRKYGPGNIVGVLYARYCPAPT